MGVISKPYTFSANTTIQSAQINSDFNSIYSEFNGNIENENIKSGAGIVESKLAFNTSSGHSHNGTDSRLIPNDGWVSTSVALTYSSADSPIYVVNTGADLTSLITVGMKLKLTQTTIKYFIVVAITATTITLYGGTDYTLLNADISAVSYSTARIPFGFPANPTKWTVEVTDTADQTQGSPVANTWYNPGSLSITVPIGMWRTYYHASAFGQLNSSPTISVSLSTSNNSESDTDLTSRGAIFWQNPPSGANNFQVHLTKEKNLSIAVKTPYYLIAKMDNNGTQLNIQGNLDKTIMRAVCAYL
jgi:hypothetical protein